MHVGSKWDGVLGGLDQTREAGLAGATPLSNLGIEDVEMGRLGKLSFTRLVP